MLKSRKFSLAAVLVTGLVLTGCGKLTQDNYDKLEIGMNLKEIEAVIGTHDNCSSALGTQTCIWGDENAKHIEVRFVADSAITFSSEGL